MYKRYILPLIQAEARIKEYRRKEHWRQIRDVSVFCILVFLIISILDLVQRSYVVLGTTLVSGCVLAYYLWEARESKDTKEIEYVYSIIFLVLGTYYILYGGYDGFSLIWVVFIPLFFTLLIDAVKGVLVSAYFLLLLFLVFYGPLGFLLHYEYPKVVLERFPIFYAVDFVLSMYTAVLMIWTRSGLIIAQEQAREASFVDAATGLKNRSAFNYYVETAPDKNFIRLTIIYIDVNGLHELNNRLGHAAGDAMLRCVADACVNSFPKAEVFRLGGDEFLIACDVGTEGEISSWMENLIQTVESNGYTIAYGIEHRLNDFNLEDMVNKADAKMLKNKAAFYMKRDRRQR